MIIFKPFHRLGCVCVYDIIFHPFVTISGHYCLVCEPLGMSLYDFVKMNHYVGFPMNYVRDIARYERRIK